MKINELNLVYFSPTGTTRKVIMAVAQKLNFKSVSYDLTSYKIKKPILNFKETDFVLFGIPVYSGRVPATMLSYLEQLKGNNTPAALIATYGNRAYEDALLELKTVVEEKGFKVIGAGAFPVEHSIIRSIAKGRPNASDLCIIKDYGVQLNRKLKELEDLSQVHLTVNGNTPYRPYKTIPLIPSASADCTECKTCVKLCPTGAITPEHPRKTDKNKCISCMRCVRNCPAKVRQVSHFKLKIAGNKLKKSCQEAKAPELFL
ncbi:MAG: EFR1 family ferrodoxin [Lachnospiraceae bacterium]